MPARSRLFARALKAVASYRAASREFSRNARRYLLTAALQNVGYGVLGTVFAIYVKQRGFSEVVVGDVEGALALASAVVCLALPPLVTMLGYRKLFIVAGVALAVARFGQSLAPTAVLIVALGLLFGVGDGIMQTLSTAFLSESAERSARTYLFTTDYVLRVFSTFLGALVGGFLPGFLGGVMSETTALRFTIMAGAALMASSTIPASGLARSDAHGGNPWRAYARAVRAFRSWDRLRRLLVVEGLISFGAGLVIPFVALYLKHHLGASVEQVGVIQAVSSIVMAAGALLTPALARRLGLAGTVVITELFSLPFLVAIPLSTSLPVVAALIWARGVLMNMSWPVYNQLSMEGVPSADKPLVAGWIRFGWSVAWLGGSALGGRMMESSYTRPYFYTAGLYALGAIATFVLLRQVREESVVTEHAERA